jgi:hypothetical protein
LKEYENMNENDLESLKGLAKQYEKYMYFKIMIEKEINASKEVKK